MTLSTFFITVAAGLMVILGYWLRDIFHRARQTDRDPPDLETQDDFHGAMQRRKEMERRMNR